MKNRYMLNVFFGLILTIFFNEANGQMDNTVSSNPSPYCVGLTYTANATGTNAEVGNDYSCLFSQPNPSWFFLKAQTSGDIILSLSADYDIDFIVYGPFADMNELISMSGQLGVNPQAPIVDCSYSGSNIETVTIGSMVAGEYYLILVTNYASIVQEISLVQTGGTGSLDCSVMNQPFQSISGNAFYDSNQNGTKESDEYYLPNIAVQITPLNTTLTTNTDGQFFYTHYTDDTIDYILTADLPDWTNTSTNPLMFTLDTANNDTTGILFGFFPDSIYYSNTIDVVSTQALCAGTNITWLNILNDGTLPNAGIIHFTLDNQLTFISSSYPVDSVTGSDLYFSFDTLLPFHNLSIQILSDPNSTLMLGDTIITDLQLTLLDSLLTVQNSLQQVSSVPVACSYDPNNKIALPNGAYQLTNLISPDTKLEYIINFQNTGSAAAVDIEIRDDLSELIDETSFEFLSSSHTTFPSVDSTGMISFYFPGINLPDSTTNEPMSKGYVKFRVGLKSTVLPNDIVNNEARIYFDNNPPIYTNTTENILDCFIIPLAVNLTYSNQQIETNITDPNMTFIWVLNGDTLSGETNSYLNVTIDGTYTVIVSNQFGCQNSASYPFSQSGLDTNPEVIAAIYPNPSKGEFSIYLSETGTYQLNILDESGRLIFTDAIQESNSYIFDGATLPVGVYYVQITDDSNATSFYRIVKL